MILDITMVMIAALCVAALAFGVDGYGGNIGFGGLNLGANADSHGAGLNVGVGGTGGNKPNHDGSVSGVPVLGKQFASGGGSPQAGNHADAGGKVEHNGNIAGPGFTVGANANNAPGLAHENIAGERKAELVIPQNAGAITLGTNSNPGYSHGAGMYHGANGQGHIGNNGKSEIGASGPAGGFNLDSSVDVPQEQEQQVVEDQEQQVIEDQEQQVVEDQEQQIVIGNDGSGPLGFNLGGSAVNNNGNSNLGNNGKAEVHGAGPLGGLTLGQIGSTTGNYGGHSHGVGVHHGDGKAQISGSGPLGRLTLSGNSNNGGASQPSISASPIGSHHNGQAHFGVSGNNEPVPLGAVTLNNPNHHNGGQGNIGTSPSGNSEVGVSGPVGGLSISGNGQNTGHYGGIIDGNTNENSATNGHLNVGPQGNSAIGCTVPLAGLILNENNGGNCGGKVLGAAESLKLDHNDKAELIDPIPIGKLMVHESNAAVPTNEKRNIALSGPLGNIATSGNGNYGGNLNGGHGEARSAEINGPLGGLSLTGNNNGGHAEVPATSAHTDGNVGGSENVQGVSLGGSEIGLGVNGGSGYRAGTKGGANRRYGVKGGFGRR